MVPLDVDPSDWNELNRLLDEALDLAPEERERWLRGLTGAQAAHAPRLRELLAQGSRTGAARLETLPKLDPGLTAVDEEGGEEAERAGAAVGPYRLVRRLAEGGMGTIWLAERADGMVQRPVALKLPRGSWQRAALVERMGREREILATLAHPHIARLYDAGVTREGRPWLAIEYVDGRPVDLYLKERGASVGERLRLFLQVASAVAHAHARLVVHRDLKPSNVLVTAEGQARLLDFGIAKLLEEGKAEETALTRLGGRALTPGYASPEQVAGRPIGVASDVYSLGVLLYEMLAGARPYRPARDTPAALEAAILEAEPPRPSESASDPEVRRALRGDLDTVVLKALKKKPEERYATVNAFAEDVERWLQGRPVAAQPDRRGYRLRKFVLRNRLAVGAAAAVLVGVLGGAGVAVWQARVALAEKRRAEEVKEFIASIFRDADPYESPDRKPTVLGLMRRADERVERELAGRPDLRVEMRNLIGWSLLQLQETDAAEAVVTRAAAEARELLAPNDPRTLRARVLLAQVHRFRGRTAEMRAELAEVIPVLREREGLDPEHLVVALKLQAHLDIDDGRFQAAEEEARAAFEYAVARLGPRHPETAAAAIALTVAYVFGKKHALAAETGDRAVRLALEVHGGDGEHPRVIEAWAMHGRALGEAGQPARAIEELTRAVAGASAVFGPRSAMVGFFSQNLVRYQIDAGRVGDALASSERGLEILGAHSEPDSYTYGTSLGARGFALLAARRAKDALAASTRAKEILERLHGPDHERVQIARVLLALSLAHAGRVREAEEALAPALAPSAAAAGVSPDVSLHARGVILRLSGRTEEALAVQKEALAQVGGGPKDPWRRMRILTETGLDLVELRAEEAVPALEEALALSRRLQTATGPERTDALVGLGRARLELGQAAEALPLLEEADAFWREFDPENRWAGEAALWLGRCQAALGAKSEARRALERAERILSGSPLPLDARLVRLARDR